MPPATPPTYFPRLHLAMGTSMLHTSSRTAIIATLVFAGITACASSYDTPRMLGVLPAAPPKPLWIGEVPNTAAATIQPEASVAVTPSGTPGWMHVLVSLRNATPGATYNWSLLSTACSDAGAGVVGTADRYPPMLVRADGSAAAEATVPAATSRTQSARYSVSLVGPAGGASNASTSTCTDLNYTTF